MQDHDERANMLAEIGWACGMTGDRRSAMQSANTLPLIGRVLCVSVCSCSRQVLSFGCRHPA